jgi:Ala-tRNA(Pro) deacylase
MAIRRSVKQYLFHRGVSYDHKKHAPAYTSQAIAEVEHIPGREFAKTVVLDADGRTILAMLSADRVIDIEMLKKHLGCAKLALVPEREVIAQFPLCEPGAMPPLGKLFNMPLFCDSALANQAEIEFNAGTHMDTVRMTYADFAKLEDPIILGFAVKREELCPISALRTSKVI